MSALILGVGMCLSMKVIGDGSTALTVLGIIIGVIGMVGAGVNYPLFRKILNSRKEQYAGDIIRLAEEISGEE